MLPRSFAGLTLALATLVPGAGEVAQAREEHFVLFASEIGPGGAASEHAVGLAVWRRRDDPSGVQLECEVEFPADGARAMWIERTSGARRELVWREWRAGGGRTLVASGERGARTLDLVDWGGAEPVRSTLEVPSGAQSWLGLAERARSGDLTPGRAALFDPLAREHVPVDVSIAWRSAPGASSAEIRVEREVRLLRDDGTSAGAFTFAGAGLVEFRWQSGSLRAVRIDAGEAAQRARDLGCTPREVAADAAGTAVKER